MRTTSSNTSSIKQSKSDRDFLDNVLSSLLVSNSAVVSFELRDPWAIQIKYEVPISFTVAEGCLWLHGEGKEPECFKTGETFILPRGTLGKALIISSSEKTPVAWVSDEEVWRRGGGIDFDPEGVTAGPQVLRWGQGDSLTKVISFAFSWFDRCYGPLIEALPSLLRIDRDEMGQTILDVMNRFLFEEAHPEYSGYRVLSVQAAQLFLVHSIRTYAVSQSREGTGWLRGFSDPKLARALERIHQEPGTKWTVSKLGEVAGMSRSVFAKRFTELMGESPMDYLCSWRMHLARMQLEQGGVTVITLAQQFGYQSEAAFRSGFKKVTGQTPREYSKSFSKI